MRSNEDRCGWFEGIFGGDGGNGGECVDGVMWREDGKGKELGVLGGGGGGRHGVGL